LDDLEPELSYLITNTPKKFVTLKQTVRELRKDAEGFLVEANKNTKVEIKIFKAEIKSMICEHLAYIQEIHSELDFEKKARTKEKEDIILKVSELIA
jgi:hypothetical protein